MEQLRLFNYGRRHRNGVPGIVNLYRTFCFCSKAEQEEGRYYYWRQRDRLERIAQREGCTLETAIGIFAAISPNNTEDGTYRGTVLLLRYGMKASVSTYLDNRIKAVSIRDGATPLTVLGGRKVRSFYYNTLNPDNGEVVTIDGHMYGCWLGRRIRLTDAAHKVNNAIYTCIEADVKLLAAQHNMVPCALQSTLWCCWRRLHGILQQPQLALWPDAMLPENSL